MSTENFNRKAAERKFADEDIVFSDEFPENEKECGSVEEDFNIFLQIADILVCQEYRKRRFLKIFKISVSAIFTLLTFGGIFVFVKKCKAGKCGSSQKPPNQAEVQP